MLREKNQDGLYVVDLLGLIHSSVGDIEVRLTEVNETLIGIMVELRKFNDVAAKLAGPRPQ